jgi:hypothetical protein
MKRKLKVGDIVTPTVSPVGEGDAYVGYICEIIDISYSHCTFITMQRNNSITIEFWMQEEYLEYVGSLD